MKITIFGMAGTGTSTAGRALAKALNYEFLSSGNIFRKIASDHNISLGELEELSKSDSKYDFDLDHQIAEFGKTHENIVVESRLAWHFIPDSFKVALVLDDETRFERISHRESKSIEQVKEETVFREKMITERYFNYYGVRIDKVLEGGIFDLIIDTKNNSVESVVQLIVSKINSKV